MIYNEVIELNNNFQPVYDLENETNSYWKQFIPNEKFYETIRKTINSLESNMAKERKSLWLQGTYGTGKSHLAAVIKHLLFNKESEIEDFVETLEEQVKSKIKRFRENKKVFPVVIKGTSYIVDNRSFALVIEKAVKNALIKENISLTTPTDFNKIISKLKGNEINWNKIFQNTELAAVYGSKEDIIARLEQEDIDILKKIENILSKKDIHFSNSDITAYLKDIIKELRKKKIADYLMIYWDEFTGILELPTAGIILTELQNIAELSVHEGIYMFVISHRTPYTINISEKDIEKIKGRFHEIRYLMEPITTYHIINGAIKKKENDEFKVIKNSSIVRVKQLIKEIINNEGTNIEKSLTDLFPIHPYTAYLATFIARNIGSTERSIFKFLYDEKNGFKKFITDNPGKNGKIFLTADNLWDFFYEEFERIRDEKIHNILEKFKLYKKLLNTIGSEYLQIFKGILLLNVLYTFVEIRNSSFVIPTKENIIKLFTGAIYEENITNIISFIDKKEIISKMPDDLFLITNSGLPHNEIENEKNSIKGKYDTIDKILTVEQKKELEEIFKLSINREIEFIILDAKLKEHQIKSKLEKSFKKEYTIHLCLFLGRTYQELQQIKNIIQNNKDDKFKDIIFISSESLFEDRTLNKFIEYKSRARVADKHNYSEEISTNEKYAKKIVDEWINEIKKSYIEWFLNNRKGKELLRQFGEKINDELSTKIFSYGIENIKTLCKNKNIWKNQRSKKAIEIFLFSEKREDIEEKTNSGIDKLLREIIKDNNGEYIIDPNLKIKDNISENHPLKNMNLKIKEIFDKKKKEGEIFNLYDTLKFLAKPPYGVYSNKVNIALISFLMNQYIGKLFEAGTGKIIKKDLMRDKIFSLFDYWEGKSSSEKLEMRFGTEDEKKLVEILKNIFNLKDAQSLNDIKWELREWIKERNYPLWLYKSVENIDKNVKKSIDIVCDFVSSPENTYEEIKEYFINLEKVSYDLQYIIANKDIKELFKIWLKNIDGTDKLSIHEEEIIEYIKNKMQGEISFWKEENVKNKVMELIIEKLKSENNKGADIINDEGSNVNDNKYTDIINDHGSSIKVENKENEENAEIVKIIKKTPADKLKKILLKMIENNNIHIVNEVKKYLIG